MRVRVGEKMAAEYPETPGKISFQFLKETIEAHVENFGSDGKTAAMNALYVIRHLGLLNEESIVWDVPFDGEGN